MDIGSILLGLALLLVVGLLIARPLIDRRGVRERDLSPTDRLMAEREAVLGALRDLDFDHATGKISEEDYAPQRNALIAQGAEVLRRLDALGYAPAAEPADEIERQVIARRKRRAALSDDSIEAAVAARRRSAARCPHCGEPAVADDRFCHACGGALAVVCPKCGNAASPEDKFCAKCGGSLPSLSPNSPRAEVAG